MEPATTQGPQHLCSCLSIKGGFLITRLTLAMLFLSSVLASQGSPKHSTLVHTSRPPIPGAPSGVTAFENVSVIPMDSERVLTGQTVLIKGGWITALGPTSQILVPAGATRIDASGLYLIPGLSDMHAHLIMALDGQNSFDATDMDDYARRLLFRWLAYGATTIRVLDYRWPTWGPEELQLKARQAAGEILSPRIYNSGPWGPLAYINVSDSGSGPQLRSTDGQDIPSSPPLRLDSIASYLAAFKAAGYDFIKPYNETPIVLDSLVTAARRLGIPVSGHIPSVSIKHAIEEGYTGIEHPITEWGVHSDSSMRVIAELMHSHGVWNCPTLAHYQGAVLGHQHGGPGAWARYRRSVKILQDAGVGLLLGTDNPAGIGLHLELQALVEAGLTPFQALTTGTRNVAKYFGTLDKSGTVTVGKRADLLLLKGNPLVDIHNTTAISGVMLGGRWLPSEMLERIQRDSLKL
jgi:imidazolonepropionase-like amidohydrolase